MWKLYNHLIDLVPPGIQVKNVHVGPVWTIVSGDDFCGIAVTINEQGKTLPPKEMFLGQELHQLAALCKSWNFIEASIGTAALNAYHNHPSRVLSSLKAYGHYDTGNTFDDYAEAVRGKNVAVIGHFVALERVLKTASMVTVLERNPIDGDLPDSACEYVLPTQDFVFITGSAFTNKTLGRLLQLSAQANTIVIGPSTPLSPVLFQAGADEISGLILESIPQSLLESVGSHKIKLSSLGRRVRITSVTDNHILRSDHL